MTKTPKLPDKPEAKTDPEYGYGTYNDLAVFMALVLLVGVVCLLIMLFIG